MPLYLFLAFYAVGALLLIYIAINVVALRLAGEPWLGRGTPMFPFRFKPRLPSFDWHWPSWLRSALSDATSAGDDQDQSGDASLRKRQLMPVSLLPDAPVILADEGEFDGGSAAEEESEAADVPVDPFARVEAKLADLFDQHERGEIALGTYASLVQAERDGVSNQLAELDTVDALSPQERDDQRAELQRAAEAIDWCLEWANKEAVLSW